MGHPRGDGYRAQGLSGQVRRDDCWFVVLLESVAQGVPGLAIVFFFPER